MFFFWSLWKKPNFEMFISVSYNALPLVLHLSDMSVSSFLSPRWSLHRLDCILRSCQHQKPTVLDVLFKDVSVQLSRSALNFQHFFLQFKLAIDVPNSCQDHLGLMSWFLSSWWHLSHLISYFSHLAFSPQEIYLLFFPSFHIPSVFIASKIYFRIPCSSYSYPLF